MKGMSGNVAWYTRRIVADLEEFGETVVTLAEVASSRDKSAGDLRKLETRARQRIYVAARILGRKVETNVRVDSDGPYVAGQLVRELGGVPVEDINAALRFPAESP